MPHHYADTFVVIPLEFFRTKPSVAKFGAPEELMAHAVAKYCQNTLQVRISAEDMGTRGARYFKAEFNSCLSS